MSKRNICLYKRSKKNNYNIWDIQNKNLKIRKPRINNFKYYNYKFRFKEENKFLLKYSSNVTRKQLKKIYVYSKNSKGIFVENFISIFQRRLDVNIHQLGIVDNIFKARQVISHGLIKVNGKTMKNTSYILDINDIVDFSALDSNIPTNMYRNNTYKNVIIDFDTKTYILTNSSTTLSLDSNQNYRQEYLTNFLYK